MYLTFCRHPKQQSMIQPRKLEKGAQFVRRKGVRGTGMHLLTFASLSEATHFMTRGIVKFYFS